MLSDLQIIDKRLNECLLSGIEAQAWEGLKKELAILTQQVIPNEIIQCPNCRSSDNAEKQMVRKPAYIGVCQCGFTWNIEVKDAIK